MTWQKELDELAAKRELALRMGGAEGIARQKSRGKLTVRERIDRLLDPETFQEIYSTVGEASYDDSRRLVSFRPGNAIAGYGSIDGHPLALRGDDFTIHGGSTDEAARGKRNIEAEAAYRRVPLIRLLDGAGGSVREVAGKQDVTGGAEGRTQQNSKDSIADLGVSVSRPATPGSRDIPRDFARDSTVGVSAGSARTDAGNILAYVPVVSAVLGSCGGWIAIAATTSHFSVMTKDTSELFVAGPPLIKQALGVEIDKNELGGYKVHAYHTGVINNVAKDEDDAFCQIRQFLSYLPSSVWQMPARTTPHDDPNRREQELLSIIPRERRKTYDIRRLVRLVVDTDSIFEISPHFGQSLVTMFARIDGFPVAVIANDCRHDGGAQTAAACQKFERFVDLADTFHLPVVYFCDVPGFMIGPESEKQGTLRWAARANTAVREATIPYASILMRRYYGVAMGGAKSGPGLNVRYAWPSMESGSLPAAGGVMAAYRRLIEESPDPQAKRIELEERLNALASVMRRPQLAEEIIDPRDTRPALCEFARMAQEVNATQLGPKTRVGMRP